MMVKPYNDSPRPTSGHHFSDLLICPQRAWLHYYGNPKDQAKDPTYLLMLQHQGFEHERIVYENFFPNALRIPERKSPVERYRLTVEAMRVGTPVILQGYLHTSDSVGVLDILEILGRDSKSKTGYTYRVGEIKRSATLMTAHVFQAAWYTELLARTQGQVIQQACFFLKNGERNLVDLRVIQEAYSATKAQLHELRESTHDPGPHLVIACPSCHWRSVCMPELINSQHLSLIPGISRRQAVALKESGIITWLDVKTTSDALLEAVGMGAYEVEQARVAVNCIEQGTPPLRQSLRSDVFQSLRVVTLEFPELAEQRRARERPIPSNIHFESDTGRIEQIMVSSADDVLTADLSPLLNSKGLAFYGSTDVGAFHQIVHSSGVRIPNSLDIFTVVEDFLHAPVPGLELEALYSYVARRNLQRLIGPQRVQAVREVINWMARSL